MNQYLLIKQGNIHNAVEKEAFTADILIENGKIKKIALVLEGAVINDADMRWSMPEMILMKSGMPSRRNSLHSMRSIRRTKHLSWQEQAA